LLKAVAMTVAVVAGVFAIMQLVPYGRAHSNPVVVQEPAWDSPRTRELAARACFDCHSNETKWPTYAHVAPFSWVLERDVEVGRSVLNFSEWTRPYTLSEAAGAVTLSREMPPRSYRMMHPEAQLTDAEIEELARGLDATFGAGTVATRR
jgi:mono/diheme cytochrome c family protein